MWRAHSAFGRTTRRRLACILVLPRCAQPVIDYDAKKKKIPTGPLYFEMAGAFLGGYGDHANA